MPEMCPLPCLQKCNSARPCSTTHKILG